MKNLLKKARDWFPMSLRGWAVFTVTMVLASVVCFLLRQVSTTDVHVPLIFVLAVLVISLLSEGYFYGILAAVVSVFAVNWAFTYPYGKLDFSIYGYTLTFMTMLVVGIATSSLATATKRQESLRIEAEKEKMRANLLRAISHDLRTPLTSISGSLTAIIEDSSIAGLERTALLRDARDEADWLCRLVENLLSITRMSIDGPGGIVKREEVLEEVLGDVAVKFAKKHKDIKLCVTVPEDVIFVPMDPMLIEQVLMNLLDNAAVHGEGADAVAITAADGPEYVTITVSDNGRGIDGKILPHLFDGDLQLNSGGKLQDKSRYMGIGLTVCKTIVEVHSGTISAENRPEGGAAFTFTLRKDDGNDYSG